MDAESTKGKLAQISNHYGASAFGVCLVGNLVETFHPEIRDRAKTLPYAISIGVGVQKAVLDTIVDRPNDIYRANYRIVNARLDDVTFRLAQAITELGRAAIPIPASKLVSRYPMTAHVNHREIAHRAGLGWRGKNNLLINPSLGSRIRLATLLTDLEMEPDTIQARDCDTCTACMHRCPAGAIGRSPDDFDLEKCRDQVTRFSREDNFGHLICGLCLNCCPVDAKDM